MKKINETNMTITYKDDKLSCKKVVYGEYNSKQDITIIFEDIIENNTNNIISTEIRGFYYGIPKIEFIEEYNGKLKAEFKL